jgi:beta-galactosidase
VILGTPTYAVPMWLARRYPEIAAETVAGRRVGWGARQEVNFTHAAYRFHAERVLRQVVGRYRDHPAVIGYQVDNEPGLRLLYNADVFDQFTGWLRRRSSSPTGGPARSSSSSRSSIRSPIPPRTARPLRTRSTW